MAEPSKRRDTYKFDFSLGSKSAAKSALPLPQPPPVNKTSIPAEHHSTDHKLSPLKAYRRAQGLCERCAKKWSRGHKCSIVQLHVMQEVWDLLSPEDVTSTSEVVSEQLLLAISQDALQGCTGPKTIQFQGKLLRQSILILVDSGSSASFLGLAVAARLPQLNQTSISASVKVANGEVMQCSSAVLSCPWSIDSYCFYQDLKLLIEFV